LLFKYKNASHSFSQADDKYHYSIGSSSVILEKGTFKIIHFELNGMKTINLKVAAEMSVILTGAKEFWNDKNI